MDAIGIHKPVWRRADTYMNTNINVGADTGVDMDMNTDIEFVPYDFLNNTIIFFSIEWFSIDFFFHFNFLFMFFIIFYYIFRPPSVSIYKIQ